MAGIKGRFWLILALPVGLTHSVFRGLPGEPDTTGQMHTPKRSCSWGDDLGYLPQRVITHQVEFFPSMMTMIVTMGAGSY